MAKERPVRERDRYARASLREQAAGTLTDLRGHPGIVAVLVVVLGGWLFFLVTRPAVVQVAGLATGDCLYIHAADADTDTPTGRPAGTATAAVNALYGEGAERAPCDGSHSHEVILVIELADAPGTPYPGAASLVGAWAQPCADAFTAWVGAEPGASGLEVVAALPTTTAWDAGIRAGACLVARSDGQFLAGSAKDSGR